jgi:DNA repair exonuclease SbcCD ATPase subunit
MIMFDSKKLKKAEERIVQLEQELTSVNEALASTKQLVEDPTGAVKSLEEKTENLSKENNDLVAVNESLNAQVEALSKKIEKKKTVADVIKEVKEKSTPKLPTEPFEVGGEKYRFISRVFMYKGQRIVAADAMNNQDILEDLVAAKVGAIVKV